MKLFVIAGGTFGVEKSSFVLIIKRIPNEKEEWNIGNYFMDIAIYIKSDDFLLKPEMQEIA